MREMPNGIRPKFKASNFSVASNPFRGDRESDEQTLEINTSSRCSSAAVSMFKCLCDAINRLRNFQPPHFDGVTIYVWSRSYILISGIRSDFTRFCFCSFQFIYQHCLHSRANLRAKVIAIVANASFFLLFFSHSDAKDQLLQYRNIR